MVKGNLKDSQNACCKSNLSMLWVSTGSKGVSHWCFDEPEFWHWKVHSGSQFADGGIYRAIVTLITILCQYIWVLSRLRAVEILFLALISLLEVVQSTGSSGTLLYPFWQ